MREEGPGGQRPCGREDDARRRCGGGACALGAPFQTCAVRHSYAGSRRGATSVGYQRSVCPLSSVALGIAWVKPESRAGRLVVVAWRWSASPWSQSTRALARACAALRARDDGPRACEGHGAAARSEPGRARYRHGLRLVRRGARRHCAQQADREEPQGRWHPGCQGH